MSVRRKVNCASTLVEVIPGYQSKIPSKQPHCTPTCDSCDCGFPVHGLLLVSVWQLELSLSLCLTLRLCTSLSLPPLASFFFSLSLTLLFCDWQIDRRPPLPPPPPLVCVPHLSQHLRVCVCFMSLPAEETLGCIVIREISSVKF